MGKQTLTNPEVNNATTPAAVSHNLTDEEFAPLLLRAKNHFRRVRSVRCAVCATWPVYNGGLEREEINLKVSA
jgi:hypothetical protein